MEYSIKHTVANFVTLGCSEMDFKLNTNHYEFKRVFSKNIFRCMTIILVLPNGEVISKTQHEPQSKLVNAILNYESRGN